MYLNLGKTFAESVLVIPKWLLILFLLAGDTNCRKELLWQEYEMAFMQEIPISQATFRRIHDYDVVFQKNYYPDTYLPDQYLVGLCKAPGSHFERIHLLSRVNPFKEYRLVRSISDLYQTDTTYLDVLLRNRKNELQSVVYRKVKPSRRTALEDEYMMWKKEKIILKKDTIRTRLIEKWNSHLFD